MRAPSLAEPRQSEAGMRRLDQSEAELLHLDDWAPEVDTRCYDGLGAEAAENEERVREALGLTRAEEAMEVSELRCLCFLI